MQFIIDLIWNHSRSSYLIALSEREAQQMIEASAAILGLFSFAIFAAHAVDAYRTG